MMMMMKKKEKKKKEKEEEKTKKKKKKRSSLHVTVVLVKMKALLSECPFATIIATHLPSTCPTSKNIDGAGLDVANVKAAGHCFLSCHQNHSCKGCCVFKNGVGMYHRHLS